jgi:hypothetical protein
MMLSKSEGECKVSALYLFLCSLIFTENTVSIANNVALLN